MYKYVAEKESDGWKKSGNTAVHINSPNHFRHAALLSVNLEAFED